MISWKHSLKRLNEEYEMAKKKKQALDNLLGIGRISRSTFDSFNSEIGQAMTEIEAQQKALQDKMNTKAVELENQIKTLEMLLANAEIQHVTGELDQNVYEQQTELLSLGLENSKQELCAIRDAASQLAGGSVSLQHEMEPEPPENTVVSESEVKMVEIPVSTPEEKPLDPPMEPAKAFTENSESSNAEIEEEKQET